MKRVKKFFRTVAEVIRAAVTVPSSRISRIFRFYVLLFGLITLIIVIADVLVQLGYPSSRVTPLMKLGDTKVGFKTEAQLDQLLTHLESSSFTITAKNKTYTVTYQEAGVTANKPVTKKMLLDYSLAQRLTPFSIVRQHNQGVTLQQDDVRLKRLADRVAAENSRVPFNAQITKLGDSYQVVDAQNGSGLQAGDIYVLFKKMTLAEKAVVNIPDIIVTPKITTNAAKQAVSEATQQAKRTLTVTAPNAQITLTPEELWQIVSVSTDTDSGNVALAYNRSLLNQKLATLGQRTYLDPFPLTITLTDNVEVKRQLSVPGREMPLEPAVNTVIEAISNGKSQVEVATKPIAPGTKVYKNYTPTAKGIQLMVSEWESRRKSTFGVVVRRLGGDKLQAANDPGKDFAAASMYKVMVAEYMYRQMQSGAASAGQIIGGGCSIASCLRDMIVNSSDTSTRSLMDVFGVSAINSAVKNYGYGATTIAAVNGQSHTTASDMADWFTDLYNGNMVSPANASELTGYLRSQVYRKGIPAGVPYAVANKTGNSGSLYHDGGIVYAPVPYVLVIMSNGGSYGEIAELARLINTQMQGGVTTL